MNEAEIAFVLAALKEFGAVRLGDTVRVVMPFALIEISKNEQGQYLSTFRWDSHCEEGVYNGIQGAVRGAIDDICAIIEEAFKED